MRSKKIVIPVTPERRDPINKGTYLIIGPNIISDRKPSKGSEILIAIISCYFLSIKTLYRHRCRLNLAS